MNIYCLPVLQVDLAPRDLLDLIADLFDPVRPRDLSLLSIDQDSDNNHVNHDNHDNSSSNTSFSMVFPMLTARSQIPATA